MGDIAGAKNIYEKALLASANAPLVIVGMGQVELNEKKINEARQRWPLDGGILIHRFGTIAPGGNIVLVLTASRHRAAAFAAAEFLMDYLKSRAPFWKKEHRKDGTSGAWIEAKDHDEQALERWSSST